MEKLSERDIINGCVAGDKQIREEFVSCFSDVVYKTILYTLQSKNIVHTRLDLEDLHQTVFVGLFDEKCKKLSQFRGDNDCTLSSWIKLITARIVLDYIRRSRPERLDRQGKVIPVEDILNLKGDNPEPIETICKKEKIQKILDVVKKMKPREQIFFKLHFEKALSIKETAAFLKINDNTAYVLKHRITEKIKKAISIPRKKY